MSDLDNAREVLTAYDELVDSLRARVAELEADKKKQSEMFFKALKERPVAPHPVDQMANIYREMLLDAEVECKSLRTALMAVWESIMDEE